MRLFRIIALGASLLTAPAYAQDRCDGKVGVAIVLAIDTSSSVDKNRWMLQKQGYVDALRSKEVEEAILSAMCGRIAVTVVFWSGKLEQRQVLPWSVLDSPETIATFANTFEEQPRVFSGNTSIAGGIHYSLAMFKYLEPHPISKVIDVSGDGRDDNDVAAFDDPHERRPEPPFLKDERALAEANNVQVNGLSISTSYNDLYTYYSNNVRTSNGFVVDARGYQDVGVALRRKIVLEIAGL